MLFARYTLHTGPIYSACHGRCINGGRTGVDVNFGKNLIGAFYNPKAVVIDPSLLRTLPKEDFSSGMAEIIKHALIADRKLFNLLKESDPEITDVIEYALKVKADIVFNDPFEKNIRAYLNLGRYFAHAIEKVSGYQIKHGHAVAMGLMAEVLLSKRLLVLEEDFIPELEQVLTKYHLPIAIPNSLKQSDLLAAMKFDKKRDASGIKMVMQKKIGTVCLQYVDDKDIF